MNKSLADQIAAVVEKRTAEPVKVTITAAQMISATGHNSGERDSGSDRRLTLLIERIERLEEEKKGITDDIRDVFGEAKAVGYDTKIMRQIIRLRKMSKDDRDEQDMLLETYRNAVGMG